MVIIWNKKFQQENFLQNYFEKYPFELSDFQKYAIEAIVEGQHVLVTAHTGSGKTLPAEFAINYFKKGVVNNKDARNNSFRLLKFNIGFFCFLNIAFN